MSRQFRLYLLPSDIEDLLIDLRSQFDLKILQAYSKTAIPVELASPIQRWPRNARQAAHTSVHCYLAARSEADLQMWFAGKRGEWILDEKSEVIQFSGCDFDGTTLAEGRFYFQTDQLSRDAIVPKRREFLTWADRVFRRAKKDLHRSNTLDAYLGPSTVAWWKSGGSLASGTGQPALGSAKPDV